MMEGNEFQPGRGALPEPLKAPVIGEPFYVGQTFTLQANSTTPVALTIPVNALIRAWGIATAPGANTVVETDGFKFSNERLLMFVTQGQRLNLGVGPIETPGQNFGFASWPLWRQNETLQGNLYNIGANVSRVTVWFECYRAGGAL